MSSNYPQSTDFEDDDGSVTDFYKVMQPHPDCAGGEEPEKE